MMIHEMEIKENRDVYDDISIMEKISSYIKTNTYNGIFKQGGIIPKRLIIFHHNDLDGKGSAAAILFCAPTILEVETICISIDYDKKLDYVINEDDEVWFVDYSFTDQFNRDYMKSLKCLNLVWIDHHKSSVDIDDEVLKSKDGIVVDKKISGALLTYLFIMYISGIKGDKLYVPKVFKYVSDYDTFTKALNETDLFYYGMGSVDQNPILNNKISNVWYNIITNKNILNDIFEKGKVILSYEKQNNKEIHMNEYSFEAELEGYKIIVLNRKGPSMMFGDQYNEYDIVCPFYFNGKNYRYSLYSGNKDIDVSVIAKKFGGGGHPGASGFSLDYNLFEKKK